jgi:hypothetical protein
MLHLHSCSTMVQSAQMHVPQLNDVCIGSHAALGSYVCQISKVLGSRGLLSSGKPEHVSLQVPWTETIRRSPRGCRGILDYAIRDEPGGNEGCPKSLRIVAFPAVKEATSLDGKRSRFKALLHSQWCPLNCDPGRRRPSRPDAVEPLLGRTVESVSET